MCLIDLGACSGVNCANGGICVDGNCTCVEGYKGDRCTELDSELLITHWVTLSLYYVSIEHS